MSDTQQSPQMTPEQVEALKEKLKNMSPEELKEFQKKQCIFCQIISGKIEAKKVYEDSKCMAILDINPANPGHMLLMPKEHYSIMPQLPREEMEHLFMAAKSLSNSTLRALEATGTNIVVANGPAAGQKAQHFMAHIIPRKDGDGVNFELPQRNHNEKDIETVRERISKKVSELLGTKPKQETKTVKPVIVQEPAVVKAEFKEEPKTPAKKDSMYITSAKAKRFHTESCPFSQKITGKSRIVLMAEDALSSGKEPCDCTGLRKKKEKPAASRENIAAKKPDDESVNLDDIANLFGAK